MEVLCEQGCESGMDWLYRPEWIVSLSTNPSLWLNYLLTYIKFASTYTVVHNELLACCLNTCSVESCSIVLVESVLCHKHLMLCGGTALSVELRSFTLAVNVRKLGHV